MAATMPTMQQATEDTIVCKLCRRIFNDPRQLPCIHTFCFECIETYQIHGRHEDTLPCPVCRKVSVVNIGGLAALPKNQFVSKLVQINQLSGTSDAKRFCEVCQKSELSVKRKTNVAKLFCLDCQQKLCDGCYQHHKSLTLTSAHKTVPLGVHMETEEIRSQFNSVRCSKHPDEILKLFCYDCKAAVCMVCYIEEQHSTHKYTDINKAGEMMRQQLILELNEMASGIQNCDKLCQFVTRKQQQLNVQLSDAEDAINKAAEQSIATVHENRARLLEKLRLARDDVGNQTSALFGNIVHTSSTIEDLHNYVDELAKKGSPSDIARDSNSLFRRLEELLGFQQIQAAVKATERITVVFAPLVDLSNSNTDMNLVGAFLYTGHHADDVPISATSDISTIENGTVDAMATLGNRLFIARGGVDHLEVCDTATLKVQYYLRFVENISVTPRRPDVNFNDWFEFQVGTVSNLGTKLNCLAACSVNNCVYVSDSSNDRHTIRAFRPDDIRWSQEAQPWFGMLRMSKINTCEGSWSSCWPVSSPVKLYVNSAGNVLAASNESLNEYRPDGVQLRTIDLKTVGIVPSSIVQLPNGHFLISSIGVGHNVANNVYLHLLSPKGQVIQSCSANKQSGTVKQATLSVNKRGSVVFFVNSAPYMILFDQRSESIRQVKPLLQLSDKSGRLINVNNACFDGNRNRFYISECPDGKHRSILVFDSYLLQI